MAPSLSMLETLLYQKISNNVLFFYNLTALKILSLRMMQYSYILFNFLANTKLSLRHKCTCCDLPAVNKNSSEKVKAFSVNAISE